MTTLPEDDAHFKGGYRMDFVRVERLDHLGLIASVINDLGLVSLVDARLKPDDQEEITPGEALKGMILNGLGFANRPLSLTPQFFAHKPLDLLFRPGVDASMLSAAWCPEYAGSTGTITRYSFKKLHRNEHTTNA
jgi:hypothetical protein